MKEFFVRYGKNEKICKKTLKNGKKSAIIRRKYKKIKRLYK